MRKHLVGPHHQLAALGCALLLVPSCGGGGLVGGRSGSSADAAASDAPSPDVVANPKKSCMLGVAPVAKSGLCDADPELCGAACGGACVDLATDGENCGECGVQCKPRAACNDGVCGLEPIQLVAPAPGCTSLRLAYEDGAIYWSDLGHGTINRVSTVGGAVTTLATGLSLAGIHVTTDEPLFVNDGPVATGIVVRAGVVYWIGATEPITVSADGLAHGGGGNSILAVTAGGAPKTLLPAALVPGPSPVSSAYMIGGVLLETPGVNPPISALTLSPDGQTLYFAAGSRVYAMPSAGATTASDVSQVGFTNGPEHGFATALATDGKRLFFPSTDKRGGVNMFDLTTSCDPATAAQYSCPSFVYGSFPIPLLDTITVVDGKVTWSKENNVWSSDLSTADPSIDGHEIYSDTVQGFGVTGFAVGPKYAYFGESTLVERGGAVSTDVGGPPPARVLARAQPWPTSLALDGKRVYWTTTDCDISFIADSPQ